MKKLIPYFLGCYFLFFSPLFGQNIELNLNLVEKQLQFGLTQKVVADKPVVGIALSGGGARGVAQLGVLKALEENDISLDVITGTSMGSIVGGLYASGYDLDDIVDILLNTDWQKLLAISEHSREELFVDRKITEDRAVFTVRFDGFEPVIPTSLNTGQKVLNYLNYLSANAPLNFITSYDDLLYKYRAVSTDLISGQTVVLDSGSISKAMRASSSVSFLLAPVKHDSLLLVDGGLVANIPVSIVKEMGSDFTIAVNTTSELHSREDLEYPWLMADQLVSIPITIIAEDHLAGADAVIQPYLGKRDINDFTELEALVNFGHEAAMPHISSIKAKTDNLLLESFGGELQYFPKLELSAGSKSFFEYLHWKYIAQDSVSNREVLYDLYSIMNSGNYSDVRAVVEKRPGKNVLDIYAAENEVIQSVNISGTSLVNLDRLYSKAEGLISKPYNSYKVEAALIELLREYRKEGFSLAEIVDVEFDEGMLNVVVSEGSIDEVRVSGNKRTWDSIILRELNFEEGDIFRISTLEDALDNLRISNLFEEIDVEIYKESGSNILEIKVDEKIPTVFRFGLKIDNEYFTQFLFDLRDENLFGSGTELGLTFFTGPRNRFLSGEIKANRIFDTYLTYKLAGYYKSENINTYEFIDTVEENKYESVATGEYKEKIYGGSLGIGTQVQNYGTFIIEGRYERNEVDNLLGAPIEPYLIDLAVLKFGFNIDSRDQFPYPKSGMILNAYYETAQKFLQSDVTYAKFYFNYKYFLTINSLHTLSLDFRIGFGDFSMGGQQSFFGFRNYTFRGRQIFITSLDYRIIMPFKIFFNTYLGARYDIGSIWQNKEEIKFDDLKHGLGATISWDTPVGPADFSIGKSFIIEDTLPKSRVVWGETLAYFTIGFIF
jgi:NTE family protein